jgi:hypothetical protein
LRTQAWLCRLTLRLRIFVIDIAGEQAVKDGMLTKIDESKLYEEIPLAVMRFSKHLKIDQMVQLRWPVS